MNTTSFGYRGFNPLNRGNVILTSSTTYGGVAVYRFQSPQSGQCDSYYPAMTRIYEVRVSFNPLNRGNVILTQAQPVLSETPYNRFNPLNRGNVILTLKDAVDSHVLW